MTAPNIIDPTAPPADKPAPGDETPSVEGSEAPFESRIIHVLHDGFTAFSKVWHRGQEIEITPALYEETLDTNGKTWLDMTDKEQFKRFQGIMYFGRGEWPGEDWDNEDAKAAEQSRRRSPN